jgi:hypothetical protein
MHQPQQGKKTKMEILKKQKDIIKSNNDLKTILNYNKNRIFFTLLFNIIIINTN